MKFYDFVDKRPEIGKLVAVEGTEQIFADRTLAEIEDRLLEAATRDLNCDRFFGPELESMDPVAAACAAMPFLGTARVIVVRGVHDVRAPQRRALWQVAQSVPEGNTLVVEDLQPPTKRTKPETFGQLADRVALRIDTTAGPDARSRFVRETLSTLGVTAESAAINALAGGKAPPPLIAVRTDLEKLAIYGRRITLDDLLRESIVAEDVRANWAASALVEGDAARALSLVQEMIAAEGERGSAALLFWAIASEYALVWELARPGGQVPERSRWREGKLRPIARRLGESGARLGFERTVRAFEALVTGRNDDLRATLALLAALAADGRERRGARTTGQS